jgi:hypothetical protein
VCGFPIIRGSAFEQQTGSAFVEESGKLSGSAQLQKNSSGSNRRSLQDDKQQEQPTDSSKPSAVFEAGSSNIAALGPSCRPLPEVDLVTGVVNYGC